MGDAPADEQAVEDALNEILLEKCNATVDFQFSTWTDFQQKYSVVAPSATVSADIMNVLYAGYDNPMFCNLVRSVTAAAVGMFSNMYSCQFLPSVFAFFGTFVVRLLSMMSR